MDQNYEKPLVFVGFWLPLELLGTLWVALGSPGPPPWVFPRKISKIGGPLPEKSDFDSLWCTESSLLEFLTKFSAGFWKSPFLGT